MVNGEVLSFFAGEAIVANVLKAWLRLYLCNIRNQKAF